MTYPGNPSLAADVRARILDTWKHTRNVAADGKTEEARLGCDFILRLDPLFAPAQRLSDRLESAEGPVDVSDLGVEDEEEVEELAELEAEAPGGDLGGPDELDDLEALPELPMEDVEVPEAAPGPDAVFASDLRAELAELVATRDFTTLMIRAQEEGEAIGADPELQRLLGEAQEKMEAAPYVESFLEQAEAAHAAGNEAEARGALDKARSLDAGHPRVQALEASLGALASVPVQPATPAGVVDEVSLDEPAEMEAFDLEELPELPELEAGAATEAQPFGEDLEEVGDWEAPAAAGVSADLDVAGEDLSLAGLEELPALDEAPEAGPAAPSDPDPRIAELLDEGQAAFAREEFQGAIDAWSRIFLIDIDHQEAARRIELAREQKSEEERQVEEAYHEALAHAAAGEMEEAKTKLARVLELSPNHVAAAQYLEKIEKGELTPEDLSEETSAGDALDMDLEAGLEPGPSLPGVEIMVPPAPGEAPRRAAPAEPRPEPSAKAAGSRRNHLVAAVAILVVAGAVGGFLWFRSGSLFPNTDVPADSGAPPPETNPIERATQLFDEGRTGVAIAQLKRIPPSSPFYEEAQALLSRWETSEPMAGPDPAETARREGLVTTADAAFTEGRYLEAIPLYREAGQIAALSPDEAARLTAAEDAVRPLEPLLSLIRAGEYDRALRDLWLRQAENPEDAVVRRLLADSYYNLGIRSLQQGRPEEARDHFDEALQVAPDDEAIRRLRELADTYDERQRDLLYRIFVKYLAPRSV